MTETAGKILSYIIMAIVMMGCVTLILGKMDDSVDAYIRDEAVKFVDECRTTGRISAENYYNFVTKIQKMGNYTIELEHDHLTTYTVKKDGRAQIIKDTVSTLQPDLMQYMYKDDHNEDYPMSRGDSLTITIKRKSSSLGDLLLFSSGVRAADMATLIRYSGPVGYTAEKL